MTLRLTPWQDEAGHAVLTRLDAHDLMEATLVRGGPVTGLALWADWRAMEPYRIASLIACRGATGTPFAVFGLVNSGQAGVAEAALLARDHAACRFDLARLCVTLRRAMPGWCAERGVRRIEARAWTCHPTAARLLRALQFHAETVMPGFGPDGRHSFAQFAWIAPACFPPPSEEF